MELFFHRAQRWTLGADGWLSSRKDLHFTFKKNTTLTVGIILHLSCCSWLSLRRTNRKHILKWIGAFKGIGMNQAVFTLYVPGTPPVVAVCTQRSDKLPPEASAVDNCSVLSGPRLNNGPFNANVFPPCDALDTTVLVPCNLSLKAFF